MNCPKCGNRPLTFSRWLRTLNPFRIQCSHCNAQLRAGFMVYLWTLCHIPIGVGIVWVGMGFDQAGLFTSWWACDGFFVVARPISSHTLHSVGSFRSSRQMPKLAMLGGIQTSNSAESPGRTLE